MAKANVRGINLFSWRLAENWRQWRQVMSAAWRRKLYVAALNLAAWRPK